jgi:hypothetical protein
MCRNIKTLYNYEPPVTEQEISAAAIQFVRKISGSTRPSKANEEAFERAVQSVTQASTLLLQQLVTTAPPKNRELETAKARAKYANRYG